jgi:hypothetical protein
MEQKTYLLTIYLLKTYLLVCLCCIFCACRMRLLWQVVFEAAAPVGDQQPLEGQQLFPHLVSLTMM